MRLCYQQAYVRFGFRTYLELLDESVRDKLGDEEESYLDKASSSAIRVQEMVDAVLGYARVEARGGAFEPVDLEAILEGVKDSLWKEITCFRAQITSEGLPKVVADPSQMEQLFQNLIGNALKFTPDKGAVSVVAEMLEPDEKPEQTIAGTNGRYLKVSVSDTGIGINPDNLSRIFGEFEKIENSFARNYPGTGLGLSLTKNLIEMHKGKVWAESQGEGKGSTFHFMIPL